MSTSVEICNMALANIGADKIQSLTEQSQAGNACNLLYPVAVDDVLMRNTWTFATTNHTMAQHAQDPPSDWQYRYALPSGFIRPVKVFIAGQDRTTTPIQYDIMLLDDKTAETLVCDYDDACLRYVTNDISSGQFSSGFRDAVVWRLAYLLAMTMARSNAIRDNAARHYRLALADAVMVDRNSVIPGEKTETGSRAARR